MALTLTWVSLSLVLLHGELPEDGGAAVSVGGRTVDGVGGGSGPVAVFALDD